MFRGIVADIKFFACFDALLIKIEIAVGVGVHKADVETKRDCLAINVDLIFPGAIVDWDSVPPKSWRSLRHIYFIHVKFDTCGSHSEVTSKDFELQ